MKRLTTAIHGLPAMTHKETTLSTLVSSRAKRIALALFAAAGMWLVLSTVPTKASAAAAWEVDTEWGPTVLEPGARGGVKVEVGNVGDTTATGWPSVAVTLPPGVAFDTANPFADTWVCAAAGDPQTVTCDPSPLVAMFPDIWPKPNTYVGFNTPVPVSFTVNVSPTAPVGDHQISVTASGAGASSPTTAVTDVEIGTTPAGFGIIEDTFKAGATNNAGVDYTQAGGRPDDVFASLVLTKEFREPVGSGGWTEMIVPVGSIKDTVTEVPPGLIGNPSAVTECSKGDVIIDACPVSAQIGVAEARQIALPHVQENAIYNVVPDDDAPAQFMFNTGGGPVLLTPVLRSDGNWGINVEAKDVTEANPLFAAHVTLWGDPADPANDAQRCALPSHVGDICAGYRADGNPAGTPDLTAPHPSPMPRVAFLSNPTRCDGTPEIVSMHLSPWETPGSFEPDGDPNLSDPLWESYSAQAPPLAGCESLVFDPSIDVGTSTKAPGRSSGLEFTLNVPQNHDPEGLATAHLRNAKVTLPPGTTVNSGSADGLDSCSASEIGLVSKAPLRFTKLEPTCPLASKIGTVTVETALLDEPLNGDVFLAAQGDHPFDSLAAIYMVIRGPGILGKLAGEVNMDPNTRILSTTVLDNPQVPFDKLTVRLKTGDRAPLTLPSGCGTHQLKAEFTSWAGHEVTETDGFNVDCPGNSGVFNPTFVAGTSNPVGGSDSPMRARITRDAGKELGRVTMDLPRGLLAGPRNVDVCTDAQLQSGALKTGRQLQVAPSCPASSQIGTTTVGVGSGLSPFYPLIPGTAATGRIFLTGTHHASDAPAPAGMRKVGYGAAIEVPAVAGPFDLGRVVVRAAIYADPATADLKVVSDKLPAVLTVRSGSAPDAVDGVVLNARDVRVDVDRANFVRNPSSCREQQFGATIQAQDGTTVQRSTRFQVSDCASLGFKPRLGLRLTGRRQMTSEKHPGIKATFRLSPDHAGVKRAKVTLPGTLALDSDNANGLCEFVDGTKPDLENHCPAGSKVGRARATSPLLKRPLSGDVFFVKNVRRDPVTGNPRRTLPMIIVALRGEIAVNLRGESDTARDGRLVSTFATVPDAPVSQFNLNIKGGRNGIILVTENRRGRINICKSGKQIAEADTDAQNGKRRDFNIRVKTPCAKKSKKKKAKRRGSR